ncbi:MAG: isoprenylcysteine carboxylmethyltransferase family protein [Spirochaetes bacterium]|nr:isoprenylcysteine carboxylmethyltransferase family protein [Spirochaetota bacterium]
MSISNIEIGNGWIISLIYLAVSYLPMLFGGKAAKRLVDFSFASKKGKINSLILTVLFIFLLVYPVFLQIHFNSVFFYAGLAVFILSAIGAVTSFINYFSTPLDQTICRGMYKISRNPIYVTVTAMGFGMALMLHSPVIAVILAILSILQHLIILEEEEFCINRYGESYIEFRQRVPRYLPFF